MDTVKLNGDYTGTEVKVRLNPPLSVYDEISTDTRGALAKIIFSWNLVDEDGVEVPLDAKLSGATDEELALIVRGYLDLLKAKVTLPNSDETPYGIGTPTNT